MVVSYHYNKVLPDFFFWGGVGREEVGEERKGREKLRMNIFVWGD